MYPASPYTVLPVPRYSIAESPFLSVWRLQWASLRQHFTFCTGVRHRRSLEGEAFYLQAALRRDVRRLDRGPTPPTVVERESSELRQEEWVRIAVDAYTGLDDSLLDFFRRMGERTARQHNAVPPCGPDVLDSAAPCGGRIYELIAMRRTNTLSRRTAKTITVPSSVKTSPNFLRRGWSGAFCLAKSTQPSPLICFSCGRGVLTCGQTRNKHGIFLLICLVRVLIRSGEEAVTGAHINDAA